MTEVTTTLRLAISSRLLLVFVVGDILGSRQALVV